MRDFNRLIVIVGGRFAGVCHHIFGILLTVGAIEQNRIQEERFVYAVGARACIREARAANIVQRVIAVFTVLDRAVFNICLGTVVVRIAILPRRSDSKHSGSPTGIGDCCKVALFGHHIVTIAQSASSIYGEAPVLYQQRIRNGRPRRVNQYGFGQQNVIAERIDCVILIPKANTARAHIEVQVGRFHICIRCRANKLDRHANIALVPGKVNAAVFQRNGLPGAVIRLDQNIAVVTLIPLCGIGYSAIVIVPVRVVNLIAVVILAQTPIIEKSLYEEFIITFALGFQFKGKILHRNLGKVKPEPNLLGAFGNPVLSAVCCVKRLRAGAKHTEAVSGAVHAVCVFHAGLVNFTEHLQLVATLDIVQSAAARAIVRNIVRRVVIARFEHQHFAHGVRVFGQRVIAFLIIHELRDVGNDGRQRLGNPAGAVLRKDFHAETVGVV